MLDEYCPDLLVLAIPLRNKFRGITTREVALFRGAQGWSEFSPFLEYDDHEAATWMRAAQEAANAPWPKLFRNRVAINATLPMVEPTHFPGSTTVKIKVDDFEKGALLVDEVLNLNAEMRIRLDINGGWSAEQARTNLLEYHLRFGKVFDYVEQPCISLSDLAEIKSDIAIPIAVDESIRKNLSAEFSSFSNYADIAIVKWQPVGGFAAAHTIAEQVGLPVVISSALETGVGISHGLALAASFSEFNYACGLGTVALLESDTSTPTAMVSDGYLEVERREPVGFERYLATPERTAFWKQRILRVLELMEGQG
jgi:O-succinylbenzoate synthase